MALWAAIKNKTPVGDEKFKDDDKIFIGTKSSFVEKSIVGVKDYEKFLFEGAKFIFEDFKVSA